jgi:hypothetical protein
MDDDDLLLVCLADDYECALDEMLARGGGVVPPAQAIEGYITEDASQNYITEDASSIYIPEGVVPAARNFYFRAF